MRVRIDPIHTPRLTMRRWRPEDGEAFATMFADPKVMEFYPPAGNRADIDAFIQRIERHFATHGFGLWAVEVPEVAPFIGYVGLAHVPFEAHFTPAVEIGWRLMSNHWGKGYATEAARAALNFGFSELDLKEIVSFTVPANRRSWRVMEKIGMSRSDADDFDHPRLEEGHWLRRHVLYRISRERWFSQRE